MVTTLFVFCNQKKADEIMPGLVGSEMCIRVRCNGGGGVGYSLCKGGSCHRFRSAIVKVVLVMVVVVLWWGCW